MNVLYCQAQQDKTLVLLGLVLMVDTIYLFIFLWAQLSFISQNLVFKKFKNF